MQPDRARTSGLGVPPLLLARLVGWVAPVRPTHGVLVLSCPSAALRVHVCAVSWATWLLFTGVPAQCVVLLVRCPGPLGSCSPVCPPGVLCCVCGVLGHLAPVHRCARSVRCFACAVSWATWLLFTSVPVRCVVLRLRCPWPLGSCSPVRPLGALLCCCGVPGHLAPDHQFARLVRCFACAVSWATWILFSGVPARCVVLRVQCPGPLRSCSPVCPLRASLCMCGVLGHLAPVHTRARSVCCGACAVSRATWLLFTGAPAGCVAFLVQRPGLLGSYSPLCPLGVLCCVCGVLGHLAPVNLCACSARCFACAVSWATWLLFTGAPARCDALFVRCLGPLGSCSPVCLLGVLCCVCGVPGHLALLHRCARSVPCFGCVVSGPLGSCSPVCPLGALLCLCGVLGHLAPVQRCARVVCGVASAVSWATWLLFIGAPARCVALSLRCPGPLGSCSPVCPLGLLCCWCGVLGHLAPVHRCALCCVCGVLGRLALVHRCARSVCCVACAVFWATWLLFTVVPAPSCALLVRRPGPLGSCSPVCLLDVLCCACGVLGHLAPVQRCARSVCCVARAVSGASWLLFTGVPPRCVVLSVRCPRSLGPCSLSCSLGVLCGVCGVLGLLAPVHRCARSVCCAAGFLCAASLRGAPSSIRTPAIRSRQRLGSLPGAHSSIQTAAVCSRHGLGSLPGAHTSVRTAAGAAWPLSVCLGCRRRRACLVCLVAPRGAPRLVRSRSSWCFFSAFLTLWCLSPNRGLVPPALLGGSAGHAEAGRKPGSLCLPLAPAEAGALGSLRLVPVRAPAMGLSLAGPSGVGLGLRALRWLACVDPVTVASGFLYRLSFDGGLGWCTRPFSHGRQPVPLRVGGRHAWVQCVCACTRPPWPGLAGLPAGRVLVRLNFSSGRSVVLLCSAPSGLGLPFSWSFVCPPLFSPPPPPFFLFFRTPPLSLSFFGFRPRVPRDLALWFSPPPPPGLWFFFSSLFCAPPLSLAFSLFRPRVPWASALCVVCFVGLPFLGCPCALTPFVFPVLPLAAPWWLQPPPIFCPAVFLAAALCSVFFCFFDYYFFFLSLVVRPRCLWLSLVSGPGCPGPWRCVLFVLLASRFSARCALSPLLCFPPGRWLLPGGCRLHRLLLCLAVFVPAARCSVFFSSFVVRPCFL